ncbi:MAG: hypothetical protein RIQ81_1347 [Pseudomonadota bacterium]|jgi:hypothetical protein
MKETLLAGCFLALILALLDLWKMSGGTITAAGAILFPVLLAVYLTPIVIIYKLHDKFAGFLGRSLWMLYVPGMVGFTLYLPCLRYFPGYKSDALEALKYIFGPILFQGSYTALIFSLAALRRFFIRSKRS